MDQRLDEVRTALARGTLTGELREAIDEMERTTEARLTELRVPEHMKDYVVALAVKLPLLDGGRLDIGRAYQRAVWRVAQGIRRL